MTNKDKLLATVERLRNERTEAQSHGHDTSRVSIDMSPDATFVRACDDSGTYDFHVAAHGRVVCVSHGAPSRALETIACAVDRMPQPGEVDPDQLYDDCTAALERGDYLAGVNAAQALKEWTFTDAAREYGNKAITGLRSYCDMVVLAHGHKATEMERLSA